MKRLTKTQMKEYYNLILKFILWDLAAYHLLIGFIGMFYEQELEEIAHTVFNIPITITPEILWIIKPAAAYVFVFGIFMGVAAYNPQKYRAVIYAGLVVLALRLVQYIQFNFTSVGVDAGHLWHTIVLMFVVILTGGIVLFLTIVSKPDSKNIKKEKS